MAYKKKRRDSLCKCEAVGQYMKLQKTSPETMTCSDKMIPIENTLVPFSVQHASSSSHLHKNWFRKTDYFTNINVKNFNHNSDFFN